MSLRPLMLLLLPMLAACSLETAASTAGAILVAADQVLASAAPERPAPTADTEPPIEPSFTPAPAPSPVPSPAPTARAQGVSAAERELYELIMAYRAEKGLPSIPLSASLSRVARLHVDDLQAHPPEGDCNPHSWSAHGAWTPVCYTDDHAQAVGMWSKPRELTAYQGNGYEIAYMAHPDVQPENALGAWQGSPAHHVVMVNEGSWASIAWQAIGVGISENYAAVWFGEEPDPAGAP